MRIAALALGLLTACGGGSEPSNRDAQSGAGAGGVSAGGTGGTSGGGSAGEASGLDFIGEGVRPFVERGWFPSVVVAVLHQDRIDYLGFGSVSDSDPTPPTADTLYEIGSVTKVVTGALLSSMVVDGDVTESTPVEDLLPPNATVPEKDGSKITLADLATHHSGLPRAADNMPRQDLEDPYADYSTSLLYEFLESYTLPRLPGESYEYSNIGTGLLGHALGLRAGSDYLGAVTQRVLQPLTMSDTSIAIGDADKARLAPGHDAELRPYPSWSFGALEGTGALRSTAHDVAQLAQACLRQDGPLGPALAEALRPHASGLPDHSIGYFWNIRSDGIAWKNGQTGGYHAVVAVAPDDNAGVVMLTNAAAPVVDSIALAVLNQLRGREAAIPEPRAEIVVPAETLSAYVGRYRFASGDEMELALESSQLVVLSPIWRTLWLRAEAPTRFYTRFPQMEVEVVLEGQAVTGLSVQFEGQTAIADRLPD